MVASGIGRHANARPRNWLSRNVAGFVNFLEHPTMPNPTPEEIEKLCEKVRELLPKAAEEIVQAPVFDNTVRSNNGAILAARDELKKLAPTMATALLALQ